MENELDKLYSALNRVKAGGELKDRTECFLKKEIIKRSRPSARPRFIFAAAGAIFILLLSIGILSYVYYFTPSAFIDMDINPSVGLIINRFGNVIGTQSYNEDGASVLKTINLGFKQYNEAADILLEMIINEGYLENGELISVTVQSGNEDENDLLTTIRQTVSALLTEHNSAAQPDIYIVSNEVKTNAQEHHVTPAKYLAIIELQEADPTATFEGCMGHSISELRELTRRHFGNHGINGPDTSHGKNGGHHGMRNEIG